MKINVERTTSEQDLMVDVYNLDDYHHLIDSPLMYCIPDTTIIKVADTEVLVSVYSPKGMVKSDFIGKNVEELLNAQKEFLGGELPVDKYAFLFYFEDPLRLASIQGALEHSYSSYYYLPEVPQENLQQTLIDIAAHEFFHIVTPLNVHSEEIEYFDFNEPEMSKHLWLYEGITEYFAGLVQVKYDLISKDEYLNSMRVKMVNASSLYNDTLSFTDLSEFTLDLYPDQYNNVYQKGALIGMCLDIKLRELSNGSYGVQDLLQDLSSRFGKQTPFKDDELFDIIEEITYPEVREFIDTYIVDGAVLPYGEVFGSVGINYEPFKYFESLTFGFTQASLGLDFENQELYIRDQYELDEFGKELGFQNKDVIVKMNDKEVPGFGDLQGFLEEQQQMLIPGEEFSYTVRRGEEIIELSTEVFPIQYPQMHILSWIEEPSESQLSLRDHWLEPRAAQDE
jgi:predicted metalloprotease with PDZ domain